MSYHCSIVQPWCYVGENMDAGKYLVSDHLTHVRLGMIHFGLQIGINEAARIHNLTSQQGPYND